MKLWDFLKSRMLAYADRVAFTKGNVTYRDLIKAIERNAAAGTHRLRTAGAATKQEQATRILRVLAAGDVAVPVSDCYGDRLGSDVSKLIEGDQAVYDDLAFVMFTSGSTGAPKGVMLSDENIIENILAIEDYFRVCPGQKLLISRPLVHISAVTGELLFGLCRGLELDFYEEPFSAKRLARYIDGSGTEVFCCTPTVMRHLSNYLTGDMLKTVSLSGERLSPSLTETLSRKYGHIGFYNAYGMTECSPRICALTPEDFSRKAGSVGRPVKGTAVSIDGGELCVSSKSVMRGYYRQSGLTRDKLSGGLLRTGDAAERDSEGYYYILGRTDEMIIRAGLNIYPQEIEGQVASCPGVDGCLVYGEEDENFSQRICLRYTGEADNAAVASWAARRLPAHLMPGRIERASALPLTPGGKVRRV